MAFKNTAVLMQKRAKLIVEATAIHDAGAKEKRALTETEKVKFAELMASADEMAVEIRNADLEFAKATGATISYNEHGIATFTGGSGAMQRGSKPENYGYRLSGFESEHRDLAELAADIRWPEGRENRVMSMGTGGAGGFLVPDTLLKSVFMRDPGASIVRSRATILPNEGDHPDAAVEVPYLDPVAGVTGGLVVTWIGEGGLKPETTPSLGLAKLVPQELAAHTVVTDKLLRNSPGAAGAFLNRAMGEAMRVEEDTRCLVGDGIAKPLGVLNAPCRLDVARAGAGAITYVDVRNMVAALTPESWGKPSTCWVCTQDALPQILGMVDPGAAGTLLIRPSEIRPGQPIPLLGMPLVVSGRTPTLGNRGDLMLCDFSYGLLLQGSGPRIEASQHPLFRENSTVVKCWTMLDFQPWLAAPVTLENGAIVSPFIMLS